MATLTLRNIRKSYGTTEVIRGVDLEVEHGEFVVFVGPSGCGKSTLLRLVSGLDEVDSGDILIDGERVNDATPFERGIAMVFQSYALYPHMTVAENMGFPLKMIDAPQAKIDTTVSAIAKVLQLEQLLDRKPDQLSGGQKQRVAMGRTIVRDPKLFLFDEPLSNLDADLRIEMRIEIEQLHNKLDATMIYVTHDQVEAMTLADRIVVLRNGMIEQTGEPLSLYEHPVNMFVASFLGAPKINYLSATLTARDALSCQLSLSDGASVQLDVAPRDINVGDALVIGVRPEDLSLEGYRERLPFTLELHEKLGPTSYLYGNCNGERLVAEHRERDAIDSSTVNSMGFNTSRVHLFSTEGQSLLI